MRTRFADAEDLKHLQDLVKTQKDMLRSFASQELAIVIGMRLSQAEKDLGHYLSRVVLTPS